MRLVLLGAPGSGKGTQGRILADRFGLPYIASGQALRTEAAAGTAIGREAAGALDRGDLVDDKAALAAVHDALDSAAAAGGYVLDGYPRTIGQAQDLDAVAPPDAVVYLAVPEEVARRRLAARVGAGRTDDVAGTIEHRLRRFHTETEPLLEFYRPQGILTVVDADQPPDVVAAAIIEALASTGHAGPGAHGSNGRPGALEVGGDVGGGESEADVIP